MYRILWMVLLSGITIPGWSQDAENLLRQSAARYRALDAYDIEADVNVATETTFGEQTFEMSVRMAERPPSYVRAEVDGRMMQLLVVMNDEGSWMYMPEQNEYAFAADSAPTELGPVTQDLLGEYMQLDASVANAYIAGRDTLSVGGDSLEAIIVDVQYQPVATAAGADSTRKRLWIQQSTGLVLRDETWAYVSSTPLGEPLRVREVTVFRRLDVDDAPPLELFAFQPPAGAIRVDSPVTPTGAPNGAGEAARDFSLSSLEGDTVALADYRGKVVLVNFWATWCGPCRMEMPALDRLKSAYDDAGLVVLGVNAGEPAPIVRRYVEQAGHTFEILLDDVGAVARLYGVHSLPTTIVVDRDGRVSTVLIGAHPEESLLQAAQAAGIE